MATNFTRQCPVCEKWVNGNSAEGVDMVLTLHIKFTHPRYYDE